MKTAEYVTHGGKRLQDGKAQTWKENREYLSAEGNSPFRLALSWLSKHDLDIFPSQSAHVGLILEYNKLSPLRSCISRFFLKIFAS